MEQHYLSALKRSLRSLPSRRDFLRGIAGAGLGVGVLRLSDDVDARTKKKKGKSRKNKRRNGNSQGGTTPPPPPTNPTCIPTCPGAVPCGPDGCGGSCGTCRNNETCQNGTCVCVPQCAPANACGTDGCGGSCGTCPATTCQGTTLTNHVCNGGICAAVPTNCAAGQVCFQNACCTKLPRPACHKQQLSDGCGGVYPPNCGLQQFCCEGPNDTEVCQSTACP
jgi:hypothetical protein